jgi:predicted DNA binding CopG/RHH family protein
MVENEKRKAITIRLSRDLWQKTRKVLFDKNLTYQEFTENALKKLVNQ